MTIPPYQNLDIVGEAEIADRLGVKRATVHTWVRRKVLPPSQGIVSGQPAWQWTTIEAWAQERFALRRPILELLSTTRGFGTSTIAAALVMQGVHASISQVARSLNGMYQQGLVSRAIAPHDWQITDAGRKELAAGEVPNIGMADDGENS